MEFLRQYFWVVLLLAIILVSLVIVMIFIIINVCISKTAAWYSTQARPNHYDTHLKKQKNLVHHKDLENEKPPLPSRDQFKSMHSVDQSYEDLEPTSDYVEVEDEPNPPAPQQPTFTPHYTTVETKSQDQDAVSEDYDDVEMPANDDSEDYDDIG